MLLLLTLMKYSETDIDSAAWLFFQGRSIPLQVVSIFIPVSGALFSRAINFNYRSLYGNWLIWINVVWAISKTASFFNCSSKLIVYPIHVFKLNASVSILYCLRFLSQPVNKTFIETCCSRQTFLCCIQSLVRQTGLLQYKASKSRHSSLLYSFLHHFLHITIPNLELDGSVCGLEKWFLNAVIILGVGDLSKIGLNGWNNQAVPHHIWYVLLLFGIKQKQLPHMKQHLEKKPYISSKWKLQGIWIWTHHKTTWE